MRAITFRHRDAGRRYTVACIQQVLWFIEHREPESWTPWPHRERWRQ